MSAILIAEDEDRIAAFVAKGLRAAGFATQHVSRGDEALEWALTGEFDLMVLDVGLPGIDGFEVLERLRGSGSSLPVIMLTARSSGADTVAGLEGGANDYMPKPFRFDELLARIRLRISERPSAPTSDLT
nr:response regulator [Actinomycetota bacterium]